MCSKDPLVILKGRNDCFNLKVKGTTGPTGYTGPAGSNTVSIGPTGDIGPTGPSGQPFQNILFNTSGTGLQTIPPLTDTVVTFPNDSPLPFNYIIGDISYNTTTSIYTINTAGFYYFYTVVDIQSDSNISMTLHIEKSSLRFASSHGDSNIPQILTFTLIGQCLCSVGDEIRVHLHNTNTVTPLFLPDLSLRTFGGYRIA